MRGGSIIGWSCHKCSRQKYACRDKTFVATKLCLSRQKTKTKNFVVVVVVVVVVFPAKHTKHVFVATKLTFCRDKHVFVATKLMLVAAPASDSGVLKQAAKSEDEGLILATTSFNIRQRQFSLFLPRSFCQRCRWQLQLKPMHPTYVALREVT